MAVNIQFAIAVHLMAGMACSRNEGVTSAYLAASVNTSPSFVRRTLAKLSKAGLVEATTGKGGSCRLAKDAGKISLLDIYHAVEAPKAFAIHRYAEQKECAVSCHIKGALEKVLTRTQTNLESTLGKITLVEIVSDITCA